MFLNVIDIDNKKVGAIEVKDDVFGGSIKKHLLYETVKMQMANKRSGTASTKTKGFVSGGGIKPWKQKGTGRARSGSIRSPLWRHGGTVFGPHPRDYSYDIPKKARTEALKSALSLKIKEDKIKILDNISVDEPKTKKVFDILKKINAASSLIVIDGSNKNLELAARNLKHSKVLKIDGLNVYDVLNYENLLITRSAFQKIEERFC
ncbi:MAG: 50S ribosomal protein L4 [Deltaproteobacteria bacterium]|nr:50S ribosomal protein L4 [Deltaproteobacteria bacterium]